MSGELESRELKLFPFDRLNQCTLYGRVAWYTGGIAGDKYGNDDSKESFKLLASGGNCEAILHVNMLAVCRLERLQGDKRVMEAWRRCGKNVELGSYSTWSVSFLKVSNLWLHM